jgi:hypothetical protein
VQTVARGMLIALRNDNERCVDLLREGIERRWQAAHCLDRIKIEAAGKTGPARRR